jgi:hypothetical protein
MQIATETQPNVGYGLYNVWIGSRTVAASHLSNCCFWCCDMKHNICSCSCSCYWSRFCSKDNSPLLLPVLISCSPSLDEFYHDITSCYCYLIHYIDYINYCYYGVSIRKRSNAQTQHNTPTTNTELSQSRPEHTIYNTYQSIHSIQY